MRKINLCAAAVAVTLWLAASGLLFIEPFVLKQAAEAADHTNLEEGLPVEVEDAYPTAFMNRELQGFVRYERADEAKTSLPFSPALNTGSPGTGRRHSLLRS